MNDPLVRPIHPPSLIGVFGGGQLGRMFAQAAKRLGYRVAVYTPETDSPASQIADQTVVGAYEDEARVRAFAESVAAATIEFENIPSRTLEVAAEHTPVQPRASVLYTTQHRLREKQFLSQHGFPVTAHRVVRSLPDLQSAAEGLGFPFILKTSGFGYDGKGQRRVEESTPLTEAWLGQGEWVAEKMVAFHGEFSVIGVRHPSGEYRDWGPIDNAHRHHILDLSSVPSTLPPALAAQAKGITRAVIEKLQAFGVICVEFFHTESGEILVNEIAPRTHNSGHLTIEGAVTSQFENQVRALCGLPLGDTAMPQPTAMANLLGDLWFQSGSRKEPQWQRVQAGEFLHLYGKREAKPGRKMGHLTTHGPSAEAAKARAAEARTRLIAE